MVDKTRALLFQSAQAEYSEKSASNAFSHFKSDDRYLSEKIADSRNALAGNPLTSKPPPLSTFLAWLTARVLSSSSRNRRG